MPGIKKTRYEKKCDQCGDPFVASMKNARFCSSACKAKWNREQKKRINLSLLRRVLKDAYERGEREIDLGRDTDPFLSRKDLKDEKSVGIYEFSVRRIEGKTGVYTIVKKC